MKTLTALVLVLGLFSPVLAEASTPKDKTAPSVVSVHIGSNNANPAQAKAGDKVTITFTANEKVTPIVLVNTHAIFVKARNSSGNSWDASYTVGSKDPTGKVAYLLTLVDTAGNISLCSSVRLPFIGFCPPTDGSSVTVIKPTAPVSDTVAPVIAVHANVAAATTGTSTPVSYALPTATDNVDATVTVACLPASGSTFTLGTTTVACTAKDAANNTATSSFKVVVTATAIPDTTAPVIAPHADVVATTTQESIEISYELPTATDNRDSEVVVACEPASGSAFVLGTTTVTCTASDAAGNTASSTFAVGVYQEEITTPEPVIYTMKEQNDESFLCGSSWLYCNDDDKLSFVNGHDINKLGQETNQAIIDLGEGSTLGGGALQSITIARDETNLVTPQHIWFIMIRCYTEAGDACPDWVEAATQESRPDLAIKRPALLGRTDIIAEEASQRTGNKYWTANFSNPPANGQNFNGSPVMFNPSYRYELVIDDTAWDVGVYGSESLAEPYWVMRGIK
ncbi:MAG: Hyalin [Candidatus Adlerbacteria bacterium]|nr:Hyalin [Candidatus Adlerbacteria bacterium]